MIVELIVGRQRVPSRSAEAVIEKAGVLDDRAANVGDEGGAVGEVIPR